MARSTATGGTPERRRGITPELTSLVEVHPWLITFEGDAYPVQPPALVERHACTLQKMQGNLKEKNLRSRTRGTKNAQKATLKTLLNSADANAATLRNTVRTLLNEMALKLDPMAPRWLAFGFNMPGKKKDPGAARETGRLFFMSERVSDARIVGGRLPPTTGW